VTQRVSNIRSLKKTMIKSSAGNIYHNGKMRTK
jgi:hypothetical protein